MPIVFLFLVLSAPSVAMTYEFQGPGEASLASGKLEIRAGRTSVGKATLHLLRYLQGERGLSFEATIKSIRRIDRWKTFSRTESGTQVRAFGWCFTLNGKLATTQPHLTAIPTQRSHLVWYYADSLFKEGKWTYWCRAVGK